MEKKDEDVGMVKMDRMAILQEARVFNTSPVQPRKCRILLTKLALLLFSGETYNANESTSLFFGISKLFSSKDASLRQMSYVVLKELTRSAEDIIMVTSSIMKDMATSSDVVYRANAVRSVIRVIDAQSAQAIERPLKTCIVDKSPSVSSAAICSAFHLLPIARDLIRRWSNEIASAIEGGKSAGGMFGFGGSSSQLPTQTSYQAQYLAIGVLYELRKQDRMALAKMLQQYSQPGALKSAPATMLLVRLASKLASEEPSMRSTMLVLLDGFLRHKSEMVNFEAAKALITSAELTDAQAQNVVHVLQLFLASPRNCTRFAAIRLLHSFSASKPDVVRAANQDIEGLIANTNRSIATFAITTLLRTGTESSLDRLLKQVTSLMGELDDAFKVTVVEAIRTLALKYPAKQAAMASFLGSSLREEGGFEFKRAIVEALFDLVKFIPESKKDCLAILSEYIEDCEYAKLATRILHLLGQEGSLSDSPSKFIRTISNRISLENAVVRAAAIQALGKFGLIPELRSSIRVLLTRCLQDTDDECRDRAALNLRLIADSEDQEMAKRFLRNDSMFSLPVLEHQLVMYVTADPETFNEPFDLNKVPVVSRDQADAEERTKKLTAATPTLKAPSAGPKTTKPSAEQNAAAANAAQQKYTEELQRIPELEGYGALLKSSLPVELTESETEYVVTVVKHIFKEAIVLQFDIKNTLEATVLTDVTVVSVPAEEEESGFEEDFIIPAAALKTNEPGVVYCAFKNTGGTFAATTFSNTLKFTSKEIDPTTNEPEDTGYDDEYQVEDLDLSGADYVVPAYAGSFDNVWEQSNGEEASETLQLSNMKSIAEAVEQLAKALSLQPLEGTDIPMNTSTHTLKLYGKTVTGGKVAAMIRMAYSAKTGVTVQIKCRSEEEGVAPLVIGSVA